VPPDSFVVSGYETIIPADERLNGNRLWRGKGQIVQRPPLALLASVFFRAVRTVPRAEELAGFRIQPLPNRFEMLLCHFAAQSKQLGATAMPFALNPAMLIVVIAVFEMPLGIPGTARHGPYRKHVPTLTLFELRLQIRLRRQRAIIQLALAVAGFRDYAAILRYPINAASCA